MTPHPATLALALLTLPAVTLAQAPRLPIRLPGRFGGPAAAAAPTPAERAFSEGETQLRQGHVEAARLRFEEARRLDGRDARPVFYLGEVARQQERWPDAERLFREAVALGPTMAEAHAQLGAVLREQGRVADAVPALERALQLRPSLGEARYTLALCLEDQGQRDRSLQEYQRAAQELPSDPMPSLNLGIALASIPDRTLAQRAQAVRALTEATRRGRDRRDVLSLAGPALRQVGEGRAAVVALERARTMGPPTATILGELAQALWVAGDRPAAEQRMQEAIAAAPREAPLRYLHGLMLAETGRRNESAAEFRQAATLAPGTPLAERAAARAASLGGVTAGAATGVPQRPTRNTAR
jgi:protein O-GlcNAc transferase